MPHRTFDEAQRVILRATGRVPAATVDGWQQEYDQAAAAAGARVQGLQVGLRAELQRQVAALTQAARNNRQALEALRADLAADRLTPAQFSQRVARLVADQRIVKAKADKVQVRLAELDARAERATRTLDRIAQTTGKGKTFFNF